MKRKRFPLSLCLALALVLCACGGGTPAPTPSAAPVLESTPLTETPRPDRTPTASTPMAPGDTISLDFAKITIGRTDGGKKMTEDGISYVASRENTAFFWLDAILANTSEQDLNLFYMDVRLTFDGTDLYEGSARCFSGGKVQPQAERTIYLYAVVPPARLENWETVTVQFAFNEDFAQYDYQANGGQEQLEYYDYVYEVTLTNEAV